MYIYICIYIFTTEVFLKEAIGSWPEWNLDPQPLGFCSDVCITSKNNSPF